MMMSGEEAILSLPLMMGGIALLIFARSQVDF